MVKRIMVGIWMGAMLCLAQTQVDLGRQGKAPNFGLMTHTRPMQVGTILPSSCIQGEMFFNSSASSGQNVFVCIITNTWQSLAGLGQCAVNNGTLTCVGGIATGDGTLAGEILLYEKGSNGSGYASWLAPDLLTQTYRLQMPGAGPAGGQVLSFGALTNGIALGSWVTNVTKLADTMFFSAAHQNGAAGWVIGSNWSTGSGGSAVTVSGGGTDPFKAGYLNFPAAAKTYAVLQTVLPGSWDGQSVTAKLVWAANNANAGSTVKWEIAAMCVTDGNTLMNPSFPAAQQSIVNVPYSADTTSKRITTVFSPLTMSGCAPNSILYLQLDRDGAADTDSSVTSLFGLQLELTKGLN